MTNPLLERIVRESAVPDLIEILSDRLSPTDLQSLLLEVYGRRADQISPTRLLEQYEQNRAVAPSPTSPQTLLEFDRLAFALASPLFEAIELAPVCPLGTASVVTPLSQNKTIATIRNTEIVADSTNFLALECAIRRRNHMRSGQKNERVRLCSSHRLLRMPKVQGPGVFAHFRLFALCTAGRDEGSSRLEHEAIEEHLEFYLRFFTSLIANGYWMQQIRVTLTDFSGKSGESFTRELQEKMGKSFPEVGVEYIPDRDAGRGYYESLAFHIYAQDTEGKEQFLVDGGFTDWTQQLLSNRKERLLISGIGSERVCSLFAPI